MPASEQMIVQVAQDILETLAFLSTRPVAEVAGVKGARAAVGVEYTGPYSGILLLDLPAEALPELAANMLGVELGEEGEEKQRWDALGELGNVLCGNLLGQVSGTEAVFNLKSPQALSPEQVEAWRVRGSALSAKIGLAQGWCEIVFVTFSAVAAAPKEG